MSNDICGHNMEKEFYVKETYNKNPVKSGNFLDLGLGKMRYRLCHKKTENSRGKRSVLMQGSREPIPPTYMWGNFCLLPPTSSRIRKGKGETGKG